MGKLSKKAKLDQLIQLLEARQKMELLEVKAGAKAVLEVFKPANILMSVIEKFSQPGFKEQILSSALIYFGGYFGQKLMAVKPDHPLRKMLGFVVQRLTPNPAKKV